MADLSSRLTLWFETHRSIIAGILIFLVLAFSAYLLLYKLGKEPLQDYDEATYAEVTAESLASHNFLSFTFLDNPYFNKPPLLFWLMGMSRELVPDAEAAARLPSALSGIVLIAVIMLLIWQVTSSLYGAAFGGAILATTSSFIEPARQARFDILVSLCIMLSVYAFLRALEDRRWFLWFGAFVGLGVLAKGPIELFAVIALLGAACAHRRFRWFLDPYFWGGVGISLLIVLPWHIYETIQFGYQFWDTYLFDQVIDRIKEPLFTVAVTNSTYIEYIFDFAAPWAMIFLGSLVVTPFVWKKLSLREQGLQAASLAGVCGVIAICFVTQTKAISYLIPLYPFMAVVIAVAVLGLTRFRIHGLRFFLVLFSVILLFVGYTLTLYNAFHTNGYYWYEVRLADEEKTVGELLLTSNAPTFYVYDTTTLGSIMYYSHLVKPDFIAASLPLGVYVLYQTSDLQQLETQFPQTHFTQVYKGTYLSLAKTE